MTKLAVGYEPDFAPLTFRDGNECRGLMIDVAVEALFRIGATASFVPVSLPQQEEAILNGRIDALAFKAITPEREREYDFSIPVTTSGAAWFVLPSRSLGGTQPPPGSRLVTPTKGPLISQLRNDFPDSSIAGVGTYAEALNSVIIGNADCAALNFHIGSYLGNRDYPGQLELPESPFHQTPIALAFAKGLNSTLLDNLNRALEEMLSSSIVKHIERRWLAI